MAKTAMTKNNQTGNLEPALAYAQRGLKIFPLFYVLKDRTCSCKMRGCKRIGKHPVIKNGVLSASADEAIVRQWWTEMPWANIGLATGHGGLIVVDVDSHGTDKKTGLPKVGGESWKVLTDAHGAPPATLRVKTGSGGLHYYFLTTKEIKNSQDKLGKHLDVRGHGGYVILPPSNHETGNKYEWDGPADADIADMPEWLEALLTGGSGDVDVSQDFDEKQDKVIAKGAKSEKFSPEQIIKLLEYIPPDCDRDIWWQVGAVLKKELGEKRGWEVWNDWSQKAPEKYDAKTTATQWQSFIDKGLTAGSLYKFAQDFGFRSFDAATADTPEIRDNWVFAVSIKRFVDTRNFMELDKEQFDSVYYPQFERGAPSLHVLKNQDFKRVQSVTYWPNAQLFVIEDGISKVNYWRPSNVVPAPGDVGPLLRHVQYLFPGGLPVDTNHPDITVAKEGNILLDYLAFQVQRPGEKVHWAVLLEGDQGNGKSFFIQMMEEVLGKHNVKIVHNEQLHENFTEWQRNTQFIGVEEMMAKARLDLMNKLKPMITESWCTIREMYKPPYQQPNRFNFLFLTNHRDSIIIDNTDRRYCVLKSKAGPHPKRNKYYGPLFDWMRSNGPAIAYFLANRPLDDFHAKAHAPMTEAKMELVGQSLGKLEQTIYGLVEMKDWPFDVDLVDPHTLVEPLRRFGHSNVVPKDIGQAFANLRYLNLGRFRTGDDDKVRLWAVRGFETYTERPPAALRQIWEAQNQGSTRVVASLDGGIVSPEDLDSSGIPASQYETDSERVLARKPKNPVMDREPFKAVNPHVAGGKKRPVN